jgi:hypothetical protein
MKSILIVSLLLLSAGCHPSDYSYFGFPSHGAAGGHHVMHLIKSHSTLDGYRLFDTTWEAFHEKGVVSFWIDSLDRLTVIEWKSTFLDSTRLRWVYEHVDSVLTSEFGPDPLSKFGTKLRKHMRSIRGGELMIVDEIYQDAVIFRSSWYTP